MNALITDWLYNYDYTVVLNCTSDLGDMTRSRLTS